MRQATAEERDEAWERGRRWFTEHGGMWSDAKYAAISAVAEFILNEKQLSLWDISLPAPLRGRKLEVAR